MVYFFVSYAHVNFHIRCFTGCYYWVRMPSRTFRSPTKNKFIFYKLICSFWLSKSAGIVTSYFELLRLKSGCHQK